MWLTLDLSVSGANAQNAYCVYGHPSPLAFIGFAHALCERSGMKQMSGVLAVLRHYRPKSIKVNNDDMFAIMRGAERDVDGESQIDTPRADLGVSLAFEVVAAELDIAAIQLSVLAGMRFAGGVLVSSKMRVHDDMLQAFRCLRGFVMRAEALPPSDDPVGSLLEAISINSKTGSGWVTPSLRGLRLIDDPQRKPGARGGHPHAYADPLIGVVRFESVQSATVADLWRMERHDNLIHFTTA